MILDFQSQNLSGTFEPESKTLTIGSQRLTFSPQWYNDLGKLYIIFSMECNLRCVYCFQDKMKKQTVALNKEQIHKYIKFFQNEIQNIVLFGGEPLLSNNYEIISSIFERFDYLKISMFTNGNFEPEYRDLLSKYRYAISGITVSLDGPKEVHNKRRINPMRDSYDTVIENLKALLKFGRKINISINVDMSNINLLEVLFDDVLLNNGLDGFDYTINPVKYVKNEVDYLLLFDTFFNLRKKYKANIYVNNRLINNLMNLFEHKPLMLNRCGLSTTYVLDLPNNRLFACPQDDNTQIGLINNGEISIDKSSISKYIDKTTYMVDGCRNCSYSYICPYGCPFGSKVKECKLSVERMLQSALNHFELLKKLGN